MSDSIPVAVLMCHAPIVVPEVGGARAAECERTTRAMEETADRLLAHRPDVLVVISPHAPRHEGAWGLADGDRLVGDFGDFGAAGLQISLPAARDATATIRRTAEEADLATAPLPPRRMDHGAMVPLHFVVTAGWEGPTVLVSLPWQTEDGHEEMGTALRRAAEERGERWAILASGDMSHRLKQGAPAGFHPRAQEFDDAFVERVAAGDLRGAAGIDPELRELAAEDVVDSTAVASAAVGWDSTGHEKLCYEGPFGVGYLEAVLYERPPAAILELAREAIAAALEDREAVVPELPAAWRAPRAVFVTLRRPDGSLRGCIGTLEPTRDSLTEEIVYSAVSAATRDPRFAPVTGDELDDLSVEISILEPPAPATVDDLDPARYGVVVKRGAARGVLLPDIEGVETVEKQLEIALAKGGISPTAPYEIERFRVLKVD